MRDPLAILLIIAVPFAWQWARSILANPVDAEYAPRWTPLAPCLDHGEAGGSLVGFYRGRHVEATVEIGRRSNRRIRYVLRLLVAPRGGGVAWICTLSGLEPDVRSRDAATRMRVAAAIAALGHSAVPDPGRVPQVRYHPALGVLEYSAILKDELAVPTRPRFLALLALLDHLAPLCVETDRPPASSGQSGEDHDDHGREG
jgi:hypothetical protein